MPRGSKKTYTGAQKRKAAHIEANYEEQGLPKGEAEARAWATVNKQSGGGERAGGSGSSTPAARKAQARKDSAKRAVASKRGVPRSQSLAEESKESLMQKARAKNIPGRSSMRKQELVEALRIAS